MYPTISKIFDQTVQKYPKKEALVDISSNKRWTFEEWQNDVHRLANALLAAGITKGDRVSTFLFNTSELAMTYFACAKIGAIINPINFRLKPQEIIHIFKDATPKIVIFEQGLEQQIAAIHEQFPYISFWYINEDTPQYAENYDVKISNSITTAPEVDVNEQDLYAIMYTSGTTGQPKGVLHRHRDMVEQSLICLSMMKLSPNDRGLVVAPMFHCAELHCCFLPRVQAGACNVMIKHFNSTTVLQTIENEKITQLFAAPTMWNMLLQEDLTSYHVRSLRVGLYGAAPMAPVHVRAVKEKLGIDLIQAYGQTEMGPAVAFLQEDEQLCKAGSAGKACYNHEIRIVKPRGAEPSEPGDILPPNEVGEIIVRGSCMMAGYFHREEATKKALYKGWYHTGDLGYLDEDGYLYVADRVDDMINTGGENVYPREVEDLLHEHQGVLDVAVIGIPDEKWGELVTAVIVKKDKSLTEKELDIFCKSSDRLADYKRPRKYIFVEKLPRNASGKIQKFMLRKELAVYSN
ncbi:fatty acid--CoA ligase [Bacillus aquiflavi]|uniref:Fatty acid--CoA ligase n=1 Tax=Bacillus aquiflavi TaxID=2672567 RepID=A0A6B3W5I4_9BACI|nr:fatty acid--CoA ligase [Bacillus aquiflavi]MBA4538641.1 fatty acid--CoA ligase [Bacillus aquiflavi]NEY83001.1 fatty acid--CoA ligase [Bacillus aquiflavi]UAC49587.1 fatty acid--CoA ligase [Bacillus aquiflavi]